MHPSGARHIPTPTYTYSDACDDDAGPHRHAGVIPLPQRMQSLLRPCSALSQCQFATCTQALIPSPVPACLRSLPRPSLALPPSEFESLYMRSLTPTPVPASFYSLAPAWTNIPTHKWDHHLCFSPSLPVDYPAPCVPPSHLVADPARSRLFWWHWVLVSPSTYCVSTTCLSSWQLYHNCNHRERVDCLFHVTHSQGPALPDPVGPPVAASHTPRGV